MNPELRFVFDTNVLVSAVLSKTSVPRQALDLARARGKLLLSWPTIVELHDVLARSRFARYVTAEDRRLFLAFLIKEAVQIEILDTVSECRDPQDNKFLEAVTNGQASCLVSGDQALLVLNPFRGVPVITPAEFLTWESENQP
jgi:putative PIN family toxin of toxin-antitoxin system